jgi:magnesium-transporting ATPase (P-type)
MYDPVTDNRTLARSTAVSDLGQVEYIFSDKTGTLTQNVMKFKRCSIDGKIFGSPIITDTSDVEERSNHEYQPLDNLMMGTSGDSSRSSTLRNNVALTFNTEMFLRVLSLCHTVVVEKDLDATKGVIDATDDGLVRDSTNRNGKAGRTSKLGFLLSPRSRNSSSVQESFDSNKSGSKDAGGSVPSQTVGENTHSEKGKGKDGAPAGFAFQAESPDEGALVEASSLLFDFQVVRRDASGITLSVNAPTVFSSARVVEGIQDGTLTESYMAANSILPDSDNGLELQNLEGPREETWEVLAVNRFDSTRKRMSILVRSPESLGSIPMLLCKGADSSMLDSKVLRNASHAVSGDENELDIAWKVCAPAEYFEGEWDRTATLSLQAHLGEFAREGLRTLVLGMRILTEKECAEWLETHNAASTSLKNREEKLTLAALQIERNLHIVGATAIEDKLQERVPETIAMLSKAGIKLWILTGDKRETAKEIGYATNVLTEKMRSGLIEVVPGSANVVRTQLAMEFWKLVKYAKIPEYQKRSTDKDSPNAFDEFIFRFSKFKRFVSRQLRRFYYKYIRGIFLCFCSKVDPVDEHLKAIIEEEKQEKDIIRVAYRRRNVRNRAEKIVRDYLNSPDGMAARQSRKRIDTAMEIRVEDMKMVRSEGPDVFNRACNAEVILRERHFTELTPIKVGVLSGDLRHSLVDEDVLSMQSLTPADDSELSKDFDSRKRSILERAFAVDKDVRHGRLMRHLTREKLSSIMEDDVNVTPVVIEQSSGRGDFDGPRGLVIEGEALEHMLGDSELEEILFAVANTCDSVIACRVSPAQKAKLVKLVRRYVEPEPVTLAIGDGANDVGMIQAAHVGVGISGKEGAQAVNASDFALAQFRFLQDLLLVHGRWNVNRLVTAMLFSFYKNAVITGCLIIYSTETLCSGTPFFDSWLISTFNFLTMVPIWTLGALDRCLDRDYIKAHPEVYTPTRRNEVLKNRVLIRWILLTIVHVGIIYYLSVSSLAHGGAGNSSAFNGLMSNQQHDRPGDGEGGDLKSVGFVAFSSVILLMGYKVLYESRSVIIGEWPIFKFQKGCTEGWKDRAPWSIQAVLLGSFAFYVCFVYTYQIGERIGPSLFAEFTDIVYHSWHLRALSWMSMLLVPTAAMAIDVTGKVFGNLFFPTQTQIHVEIFASEVHKKSKQRSDDDKKRSNTEDTNVSYLHSNQVADARSADDDSYEYLADEDVEKQSFAFQSNKLDEESSEYLA